VARSSRSYCFDLCGKLSEVLEQLVCCVACEHQSGSHYAVCLRGTATGRLFKSHSCKRNCYVAVNRSNTYDLRCEYFSFMKRIFERRLCLVVHHWESSIHGLEPLLKR
jgi:hypothetical protein